MNIPTLLQLANFKSPISIFSRRIFLIVVVLSCALVSYATDYTSNNVTNNWSNSASWSPAGVPGAGDNVTISQGTITVDVASVVSNVTISGGTLKLNATLTVNGAWLFNSGTFTHNSKTVVFGTGGIIGGTQVTTFYNLTVTTTNATDIVALNKSGMVIANGGTLSVTKGVFKLGAGNIINMGTNGSTTITVAGSPTGNFASANDGTGLNTDADGGTINQVAGSGNSITVNGDATFYNLSTSADGNWQLKFNGTGARINGTLPVTSNQFQCNANSPVWGPKSLLSINNNGQQYSPGTGSHKEWVAVAPGSGTIGVTPGYPNNVTIMNVGSSASNYNSNQYGVKLSGSWSINGILSIGNGTTAGLVDLNNGGSGTNNFSCGAIVIDNNSKLAGPSGSFLIYGNWTRKGSTIGKYISNSATVTFAGNGPDTISVSSGTENSFNNISVNGAASLLVKLMSPVTVPTGGSVTLNSGVIQTDNSNILYLQNTASTAISNLSASAYVDGPLKWDFSATTSKTYTFPLGAGSAYLPLTLNPVSTNTNTVTAQAFNSASGGTPDNVSVTSLSNTEYWLVQAIASFTGGANVAVSRQNPIAPLNMLAQSTTASGVYKSIGGTVNTYGVTNASPDGNAPWFLSLANGPLTLKTVSFTSPSCTGTTGSVTVAASGGDAPYQYALDGVNQFSSNNVFTGLVKGTYIFIVKDNSGNTAKDTVLLSPLYVTKDTTICTGNSVQLTASGIGLNFSWTPANGLSATDIANPVATPAATTTYYVSSMLIDKSVNAIQNGDFESGNTGFVSDYIDVTPYNGTSTLPYTAANFVPTVGVINHAGIYDINTASTNMCSWFTPTFYDHTSGSGKFMVLDGPNKGDGTDATERIWSQTVNVVPNNNYIFTYWFANADNNTTNAQVKTQINNVDVPVVTGFSPNPFSTSPSVPGWVKVSYLWNSGSSTTATISLYDLTVADVGNDFAIDDLSMYVTCTAIDSVKITVGGTPAAPVVSSPVNYCLNATGPALTATGTNLKWYDNNGLLLSSGDTYQPATNAVGTFTYYVSQTGTGPCSGESPKAQITVNVGTPAAPVVSITQPTCTVSTGTITVTSPTTGVTYSFDNGTNFQPGATSAPLAAGTTYQVVINAGGCVSVATPAVINAAPQTPSAPVTSVVQPTCTVNTGTITVTSPSTGVTYSFDNGATYQAGATSNPLTANNTYQVVVKNTDGCVSAAAPTVINAAPQPLAAPVTSVVQPTCTVNTGTITVTSPSTGVTYSFDNGATYQAGATSNPLTAGNTYQVVVKNTDGCISAATPVVINAAPQIPSAPVTSVVQPTCTVNTGTITVTSPASGVTYSFNNGNSFQAGATGTALSAGATYQVVVKNTDGCVSAPTATIIDAAPVPPSTPVISIVQPTCTVGTGSITVTSPSTGVTYSFDNGVTYQAGATSAGLNSGSYNIVVKSISGCVSSAAVGVVNTQPETPVVDAGADQTIAPGGAVTLLATAPEGIYAWSPSAGLSSTSVLHPLASPAETTTYILTVTNTAGCSSSDDVKVTVAGDCLNPPIVFTPNHDGYYDVWQVFNTQCIKQLQLDVYNRWGGLVYHSDKYGNNWDGTYKGKDLPDATYYYVIKATFYDGHTQTLTGNVTIMR